MINRFLYVEVELLVKEIEKTHRYSMSRVYNLHNKVFEKNETPQACASCLIRKVNELRDWLSDNENFMK